MFKKLIVSGATAAIVFGSAAVGAFASENHNFPWFDPQTNATVRISNTGTVVNSVENMANTGNNSISGNSINGGSITTGAAGASSEVSTQLNWNQFDCGCVLGLSGFDNLRFNLNNSGTVRNTVGAQANSGYNSISVDGMLMNFRNGHHSSQRSNGITNGSITTGSATAGSVVQSVVNTNMFGGESL